MNPQDPWGQPSQPQQTPPASGGTLPPVDPRLYQQQPTPSSPSEPQQPLNSPPYQTSEQSSPTPAYQDPSRANDYTVDYLNSIAAPAQQKVVSKFAIFGLIGGVLIAAIIGVALISAPKGKTSTDIVPTLSARIGTLRKVTSTQQKRLTETKLTEVNAALSSSLNTMNTEIEQIIEDQGIKKSQTKAKTTAEESYAEKLAKTLDDAYQRGTLNRIYLSQMTYELTILEKQLNSLKKTSKNKVIQTFCENSLANTSLVLKAYESYSAADRATQ
ncbi:MAG: hypothetical protein WBP12_00625 [Candidatus Saccharimonas sp.]